jgi:trk system potassium uptake protein
MKPLKFQPLLKSTIWGGNKIIAFKHLDIQQENVGENVDYVSMAESLDIGTIINKKAIAASYIYQMMLDADVMNVRFLMNANADVAEFIAKEGSKVTKKPVKDLGLPIGVTIGGLVRKNEGMLVSGNTQIEPGDSVMVFCHNINMKKIEKYFI